MNDALSPVVRTNLDLHFGRLEPLPPGGMERPLLIDAAETLARTISEHLLKTDDAGVIDTMVQRHVFGKEDALPVWLINKGLILCDNDRRRFEPAVQQLLRHRYHKRRFLDYLAGELQYHCWLWSSEDDKRPWMLHMAHELRQNEFCTLLNTRNYVLKLRESIFTAADLEPGLYDWYIRSLGTATLLDIATEPIYSFTLDVLEEKYDDPFTLDVFKRLFTATYHGQGLDRHGVLVLGDTPKAFVLSDFHTAARSSAPSNTPEAGALDAMAQLIARFDNRSAKRHPEARFRLGGVVPHPLANKVGALLWMRRTLEAVKSLQRSKGAPSRGRQVEERSVLTAAFEQKSILYFHLFDDPDDSSVNPCQITALQPFSFIVQSPNANTLNASQPGQEVHGYFSLASANQKSTYCDFYSTVESVTVVDDANALVEIAVPDSFELTRRSHTRQPLNPDTLAIFELSAPAPHAEWSAFANLEKWPAPLCIIPDNASHCHVRDLSAGGLMLEIHHDAPAYEFFIERNREYPLLAQIHLVGRYNNTELRMGLRLEAKRIRDLPQLRKKYIGFQITEAGEIRNDRFVRFAPVGKDGVFLINDWLFRNPVIR